MESMRDLRHNTHHCKLTITGEYEHSYSLLQLPSQQTMHANMGLTVHRYTNLTLLIKV